MHAEQESMSVGEKGKQLGQNKRGEVKLWF